MFRRRVDENREILLQAFYNLEDRLTEKLGGNKVVGFTATSDRLRKLDSIYIIASHLAEEGERVLIIDANLRSDELEELTSTYNQRGLVDLLLGDFIETDIIIEDKENLDLLMTGRVSEYEDMYLEPDVIKKFFTRLASSYDYVFVNTKENIGIAEANVFCALADKTVIFTSEKNSEGPVIEESIGELEKAGADVIGVIIADYSYREEELDDLFGGK